MRRFHPEEIGFVLQGNALSTRGIHDPASDLPTQLCLDLCAYLNFRATALENIAETNLMNQSEAEAEFKRLKKALSPTCYLPMNKQKGQKRHYNYLACMVNMLAERELGGTYFVDDPRNLIVATRDSVPIRTFSRRMDGAYPSLINPIATWEVKEYYGTTTFGSRVADGVYETLLDGYEFLDLKENEGIEILHYLFVDDHFTWWECGKSYLCRLVDMLHMGMADEILFGREILTRWPQIVRSWKKRKSSNRP
ncbi:MAG: hypothetical protein PHI18_09600 [bacterium]|nr:hypothetical protein [bacterium]